MGWGWEKRAAGRRPGCGAVRGGLADRPGIGGEPRFLNAAISSQLTINTAIVYMHRFYMVQSFTQFHRNVSGAGALCVCIRAPGALFPSWGGLGFV